jgi:hypothetical protein
LGRCAGTGFGLLLGILATKAFDLDNEVERVGISTSEFGGDAFSSILIAYCDPLERSFDRSLEPHRRFYPAYNMRNFTYYAPDESATDAYNPPSTFTHHVRSDARGKLNSITLHNLSIYHFKLSHYPLGALFASLLHRLFIPQIHTRIPIQIGAYL